MNALLLFLSVRAFGAGSLCEPIENMRVLVNYCDENPAYVAPAKICRDHFRALVKAKNAEINAVLSKDIKNRKGNQQEADFQTTQTVLSSAEATLSLLIANGKQTYNEIEAYGADFVLPIYEAYPEDYNLDPDSAQAQKIFREKNCYGEPMEDLDAMKNELRETIEDLERTKARAVALHNVSGFKEANLNGLNARAAATKASSRATASVHRGKNRIGASTVTGVEQDKLKRREAAR